MSKAVHPDRPLLGVIGGMDPAATADFLAKLAGLSAAKTDQDHLSIMALSDPQVPDRTTAFFNGSGDAVRQALCARANLLKESGALALAMPCNSAHHWAPQIETEAGLPLIHIADAVVSAVYDLPSEVNSVLMLATPATLASGFYQKRFAEYGIGVVLPSSDEMATILMPTIRAVKAGKTRSVSQLFTSYCVMKEQQGIEAIILGCTEFPIALPVSKLRVQNYIDTTEALALACLKWGGVETHAALQWPLSPH